MRFRRGAEEKGPARHASAAGREFVPPDVTPAFLSGLYDEHISSEADGFVAPHAGKWIRVSGPRGSTVPRRRGITLMRFDREPGRPHTRVELQFREPDARRHLDAIPRGTEIVVVGTIAAVTRSQIILDHCEVEETNPRSPAGP